MIRSQRLLSAPELGARHEVVAWVEQSARLHVMTTERVVCDDRLYQQAFGRADASARALVSVVLSGRAFISSGDACVVLEPGDGLFLPTKGALSVRTEGERYESVVLEWNPDAARDRAGAPARSLAAQRLRVELGALQPIAERVRHAESPEPATIAQLLEVLHAADAPVADVRFEAVDAHDPKQLRAQEIADALDAVLSALDAQPMTTDLEERLGVSSRQIPRMVDAFRERYGYGASNWLDARNRRRLMLAATLLTCAHAGVAQVARIVGYQRPETLARAFSIAGLPKPSHIRAHVATFGVEWERDVFARKRPADAAPRI